MSSPFCSITEAVEDIKAGKMVILVDDEHRENEGDLVCAAETITPDMVNFMLKKARGVLCVAMPRELCRALDLQPQTSENTTLFSTAFTVTVDAAEKYGVTTGVSSTDRATTIQKLADPDAVSEDFMRPGHINPLMARSGGVLVRSGQTEGTVDLLKLAGMRPVGALIEVMNDDGTMSRVPDLTKFAKQHDLKMCTVADLIEYRQKRETFVHRIESVQLPTPFGLFTLHAYKSLVDVEPHLALCCGGVGDLDEKGNVIEHEEPVVVRVHSECMTGDVFGSMRCDCGEQLDDAMRIVQEAGKGAVVYLRQEGRGIGLHNKLKAYRLQEQGFDTVQANEELGFPADKRDYGIGAQILRDLGLRKLRIMTNNPKKVSRLEVYGLEVVEQVPIRIVPNDTNRHYLRTKKEKMGHLLDHDND